VFEFRAGKARATSEKNFLFHHIRAGGRELRFETLKNLNNVALGELFMAIIVTYEAELRVWRPL
jgi:hypothetical protein